ncbi:hypothetical protein J7426_00965 [Tropicibacter sp. R16_0]|uniref:hypothetical protein n=1 Tax=Tropicibacter sp. R16_0 TaxID=2821102 RepID=UPI001ADA8234|nr:hypothetical protein [Tropicibacter sp. R16_0]MBO9448810.1 hypothetical protein [Tropicibacter sp. R16_0]
MMAAIGGVRLKSWLTAPEFFWRARQALQQAKDSPGCHHAIVFPRGDIYFSLSVWDTPQDMIAYAHSGPHARLLKVTPRLAHVLYFHHFPCTDIPAPDVAWQLWRQQGQSAA